MTLGVLGNTIEIWVTQYLAAFCLLTILAWAGGAYLYLPKWEQLVRDCVMYLMTIGTPTLILALNKSMLAAKVANPLVASITWFFFAMLFIMELLWMSYLLDHLVHAIRGIGHHPLPGDKKKSATRQDFRW